MALELVQATDSVVTMTPDRRGTAASVVLRDPDGTIKTTVTATPDSVSTTVATVGSTRDVMTLASASGVEPGGWYWYASADGWEARVRVASVDGAIVTLDAPLPGDQTIGDTFRGLTFSATIDAAYLGTRGRNYRLDWAVTVGSEIDRVRQIAHVVAMKFRDPVSTADVARIAFQQHPSWARTQTPGMWLRLAELASTAVRQSLLSVEDFPDRVGDHEAFTRAGEVAVRIELARLGRVPSGYEVAAYVIDQERWFQQLVREAVAGTWIDRNDDLAVDDDDTEVGRLGNIRLEYG